MYMSVRVWLVCVCVCVGGVVMSFSLKARGRPDGTLMDVMELFGLEREAKLAEFSAKQLNLDAHGVTVAALHAISTHTPSMAMSQQPAMSRSQNRL